MERAEKKELVATLNQVFKSTGVIVVAHNKGLTVNQVNDLRNKMAQAGATVKVAKNRLAKLALDGTDAAGIKDLFVGPTMVAYAADPVSAPKVASAFAKGNDKFVVLGGALGNVADRVLRGQVVDFLDFHWRLAHWPAFNLADVAITIGALCLFLTVVPKSSKGTEAEVSG